MSLWQRLFGADPKDLFLSYNPHGSSWCVVTWNFDLKSPMKREWKVEIHKGKNELIQWTKADVEEVYFFLGGNLVRKRRISQSQHDLKLLMNIAIHSTLKQGLENHQAFMLSQVSGATTLDMQNEFKALQWIQASFGTLSRALDSLKKNPDLIQTCAFFSGTEPETKSEVIRIIAFNLDIFCYLQMDQSLRIVIFDDKNMGHGESRNPTFQQIIKVTKPQFYDEIMKLVHQIAEVGEVF
jgi:hypothetical protein